MNFLFPLVRRATLDEMRLRYMAEKNRADELARALATTQIELHKHRQLLSGRAGTMKVLREAGR